jgi:outer membrane protein, heavy metal efflux system
MKISPVFTFCFLIILSSVRFADAQAPTMQSPQSIRFDTLRLTITDAEQMFIKNNLLLLAQKYNVDATEALIIQAKLYPNPNISYDVGLNRPSGSPSEQAAQIQQEIVLTRKIKKQVDMAETTYVLAKDNFKDLLRTLKYTLRSNLYNIYYYQQIAKVYDEEIHALQTVVEAYKHVEGKGYVSEAEIVQVQAQLYSLQSEYQGWVDNINDLESQTRLMLQTPPSVYLVPQINTDVVKTDPLSYGLSTLLDSAYANRTDYMIAKDNLLLSRQNYVYQKALAVPDVFLSAGYDSHGSTWPNLTSLGISINLPFFNRNQGNIKNANIMIEANDAQLQYTQKSVDEQVVRALQKAIDADKLYKGIDPTFAGKFDVLAAEMLKNYMSRNVNLLTFQAFYDSYKTNIEQLNTILFNKVNCLETLNLLTGTNFYDK